VEAAVTDAIVFIDPDEAYFNSRPFDVPAAPYDIRIARGANGAIVAAYGSPFEIYRSWMEMALECELYDLAGELVDEMIRAEEIVASISGVMRPNP
jgi:hypothetical protein